MDHNSKYTMNNDKDNHCDRDDNDYLQTLLIRNNYIGPTGAVHLAKALETNDTLQRLDLGTNTIGDVGAAAIAKLLMGVKSPISLPSTSSLLRLRHLCLWSNQITTEGVRQMAHALRSNSTLEVLNLGGNDIGDAGAQALAEMLRCNDTLQRLHIANANIGREGANHLARGLATNKILQGIDLLHNPIGWEGAAAFVSVLRSSNRTIQQIKLDYQDKRNSMERCGFKTRSVNAEIAIFLKLNQFGRLHMANVGLPWESWPTILTKVNTQADLLYLILQDKPDLLKRDESKFCS
jgi:Ran GTPase-activating protein (RanGAP) involved in mRNA processing and transport